MAITINGSGTITGISAGGLPDGVITSDDLANNAVTAGKLATTLDLSSSTVTLPSGTGGKILQVVMGTSTSQNTYTSSTTWTDSYLNATITPSATSSKVLILIDVCIMTYRSGSGDVGTGLKIERNSNVAFTTPNDYGIYYYLSNSGFNIGVRHSLNYLDSPNSTSSLTYTLYGKNYSQGASRFQDGGNPSHMVLMEVAA